MRRDTLLRAAAVVAVMAVFAASASGYYHFLHYASRTGPFVPIPEKYDLAALTHNTVYYYVDPTPPSKMFEGDSFTAALSQLRLAGSVWDGVKTSQLRVAYGGLFTPDTPQTTPHLEISFGEVPPGLYAIGGPTVRAEVVDGPNGPYVPILRSVLVINQDISTRPSFGSGFFLTAVHEMGHALGLQHTFTSSVMSVDTTRASTKAKPLGADDVAGISLLYPTPAFAAQSGSISGRVTAADAGVHLASVVALTPQGQAVSALTNPDGTYRIDGLRPGQYMVYAHALPPAVQEELGPADIVLPLDGNGQSIPAGDPFGTLFYPGTRDWHEADTVTVKAAQVTGDINFAVQKQGAPGLYDVTTYSFPEHLTIKPAYLNLNQTDLTYLVADGVGLMNGAEMAPGLNVTMLGGGPSAIDAGAVRPYIKDPRFLEIDFKLTPFSGVGPRHLVFSSGTETYVLPAAMTLTERRPPSIASITPGQDANGNPILMVNGTSFGPDTVILMDGIPATITGFDRAQGNLTVVPPPAPLNYQARVIALNNDGQTSLFAQAAPPLYKFEFGPPDAPAVTLSPASIPAGSEAMIEIQAANMTFADGQTWVGLGSSDVAVKKLWIVSPTLLRANVAVAPQAQVSDTVVSVAAGFHLATIPGGFHIAAPAKPPVTQSSDVLNADPARSTIYPGATAILPVANLPANATAASVTLTLNDRPAPVVALAGNQLTFQVPDVPPGPAVLRLTAGGEPIAPVFVTIDLAPPAIAAVMQDAVRLDPQHGVLPGTTITIVASQLGDPGMEVAPERLSVVIGGITAPVLTPARPVPDHPELHQFDALVSPLVAPGDKVPVIASLDGRASTPYEIAVAE